MNIKPNTDSTQTPAATAAAQPNPHPAAVTLPPVHADKGNGHSAGVAADKAQQNGNPVGKPAAKPEAARGDDALMSQQAKPVAASDAGTARTEQRSSKWKGAVAQAHTKWSKISVDELTRCDGLEQPLATLLEQRYQLSKGDSHQQAREFLAAHA